MADRLGFKSRPPKSESGVLPLHQSGLTLPKSKPNEVGSIWKVFDPAITSLYACLEMISEKYPASSGISSTWYRAFHHPANIIEAGSAEKKEKPVPNPD